MVAYGGTGGETIEKFKLSPQKMVAHERWSLARGGRLGKVPTTVISLRKIGILEKWSLTTGGRTGRFDCITN